MFHHHPLQRRLGRLLSGTALAVALSMAFPAGAHAAGTGPAGIWQWIEGLLADRIGAVTRDWTPPSPATSRPAVTRVKGLVCPPAGCPTSPGTAGQGSSTDPDGKP
ncbi:MAG TPA: hypothetical protein VLX28_24420 [Thermoanaerobaculia bacterium]|nr:hypothetical protein [Thermoanaerobaculia bacterium]